ncbi:methyltransferase domain-containing protein [Pendulispora brunnea]|uniref:Methyltransferase domain-containing protein n=1 Tax=Pendulispora brunnea TaxID=2905690 RepID=A0ABZ2JZI1_9BACT
MTSVISNESIPMNGAGRHHAHELAQDLETKSYYDEFSQAYERHRLPNDPVGYHALIDDLEVRLVERYGKGQSILECGCGTGLLLSRFAGFASTVSGIDLSPGMLSRARDRGLTVEEGSVTKLPFEDASFDVTCAFKVLAHVPDIGRALSEMVRVTRPGGVVLAEFYNPISFRGLVKRFGPAGKISRQTKEDAVYTRFDPPWVISKIIPANARFERAYGIRIVTPAAVALKIPGVGSLLRRAEEKLADTSLAYFGGFYVAVLRRNSIA